MRRKFSDVGDDQASEARAPAVLWATAEKVAQIARVKGNAVALVGGLAMQYYASPRLTGNVDIVSEVPLGSLPAGEPLVYGGHRIALDGVDVRLIVRSDQYRAPYKEALERAGPASGAAPLPVVQPEYIAVMKLAARRSRDALDLAWLIENDKLDISRTRELVDGHLGSYALDEFDDLVVEIDLEGERQRRLVALRKR